MSRGFLITLGVLVIAWSGTRTLLGGPRPAKAEADSVESWIREVNDAVKKSPCRYDKPQQRRARLEALSRELEARKERARVVSSDYLTGAHRLQELLSCGDTSLSRSPQWLALANEQAALLGQVERRLRGQHALLRRAQHLGSDQEALSSVQELRALLADHPGPLAARLKDMERLGRK